MTTIALLIILAIGFGVTYFLPESRKFAYFIMAVCTLVWLLTVLNVLPSRIHIP